mmetsp:Transcript_10479/g.43395  ORF Transcript_10479/g.43395 Transcript_10479/m.43395 type:complete len:465 (-) Transcript_10479:2088-3482(-)
MISMASSAASPSPRARHHLSAGARASALLASLPTPLSAATSLRPPYAPSLGLIASPPPSEMPSDASGARISRKATSDSSLDPASLKPAARASHSAPPASTLLVALPTSSAASSRDLHTAVAPFFAPAEEPLGASATMAFAAAARTAGSAAVHATMRTARTLVVAAPFEAPLVARSSSAVRGTSVESADGSLAARVARKPTDDPPPRSTAPRRAPNDAANRPLPAAPSAIDILEKASSRTPAVAPEEGTPTVFFPLLSPLIVCISRCSAARAIGGVTRGLLRAIARATSAVRGSSRFSSVAPSEKSAAPPSVQLSLRTAQSASRTLPSASMSTASRIASSRFALAPGDPSLQASSAQSVSSPSPHAPTPAAIPSATAPITTAFAAASLLARASLSAAVSSAFVDAFFPFLPLAGSGDAAPAASCALARAASKASVLSSASDGWRLRFAAAIVARATARVAGEKTA